MANEKRLIDANELVDEVLNHPKPYRRDFYRMLKEAPTVDAVEVVRCKDCKHYCESPYEDDVMSCDRWGDWIYPHDDDFCSLGERKDNE